MMSTIYPKNKGKRSRTSSNEANNSFVKNMTSRMSGLLPSTITKWFSSPKSSSTNGSAPTAESDSSTEDEVVENTVIVQPPAKRMRYSNSTPRIVNHISTNELNNLPDNIYEAVESVEPSTSFNIQSPMSRTAFQREANFASTAIISSPQESTDDQSDKDSSMYKSQHTVSQMDRSIENKRKSLFYSDTPASQVASIKACEKSSRNTIRDPKQPCFKASLLGSPFYHGRTMYGGAGASYYLNEPNVKQRKVAIVNEADNTNNTISSAARRVMDLLEHYSSPLIEAKRIPPFSRTANESFNSSINSPSTSQLTNRSKSYKMQELYVPSVASFLRVKQRSRLMESTSSARQIMASQSSTVEHLPYYTSKTTKEQDKPPSKFTSKVKSRLTRPKRGDSDFENDMLTPVVLPTGTLHIDSNNLPKFSFDTSTSKTTTKSSLGNSCGKTTKSVSFTPSDIPALNNNDNFKFSSPIRISLDQPQNSNNASKFTFGSPDRNVQKNISSSTSDIVLSNPISSTKLKEWKCADCWVSNVDEAEKCVCCGGKRPSSAPHASAKCSICKFANTVPNKEKCANCEKTQDISIPKSMDNTKWKCDDCLVPNDDCADKCICCGAQKPKKSFSTSQNSLPKMQGDSDWKCNDCWITNKSDLQNCAACGGKKPGSKPNSTSITITGSTTGFKFGVPATENSDKSQTGTNSWNNTNFSSNATPAKAQESVDWRCADCWVMNKTECEKCVACGFSKPSHENESESAKKAVKLDLTSFIKTQSKMWECSSCLIKNDENKLYCACCDAQKPGTVSEAAQKMFKFASAGNRSFKFGIEAQTETDRSTVNHTEDKIVVSETNNNVLPKASGFSFGVSEKKETTPNKIVESKDIPKVGFTFGIPSKSVTATTSSTPVANNFLASKEGAKENNDDKEQEVPKMPELKELPKTNTIISPLSTSTPLSEDKIINVTLKPPPSYFSVTEKKDSQSTQIVPSATTASESQPTFTFSSGTNLKPNNNMFGATTTSGLKFNPIPATVTTATVTSLLNTKTSNASTPFQKTESTSAPATTAPLFNFGSNTSATPVQSEKPSFNFTFGSSNKTETVFKPSFGDTNNKFSLSTVSTTTASAIPVVNSVITSTTVPANNMFMAPTQKDNLWSTLSNNNAASTNVLTAVTNNQQKPVAFSFGAPSAAPANAFGANANNATPAFGSSSAANATPAFGSIPATNPTPAFGSGSTTNTTPAFGSSATTNSTSAFGSIVTSTAATAFGTANAATFGNSVTNSTSAFGSGSTAPAFGGATFGNAVAKPAFGGATTANVFGMSNQNTNSQPSLFASPALNNSVTPLFGNAGNAPSNSAPTGGLGMFAAPTGGSTFGAPNPQSVVTFDAPAPAASFNFGSPPPPAGGGSGMFGFGQQPQAGIYNFGGPPGNAAVQFNMGSGQVSGTHTMPMTARKIRKATRRSTAVPR